MPTTSNPARAIKAAVTDESTPPDIATTMRWSAGGPAMSMSASGIEAPINAHLPEIGFEPGGGGKRCGQGGETALAAASRKLLVERRRGFPGEVLVVCAGIHVEPFAIGIALAPGRRV